VYGACRASRVMASRQASAVVASPCPRSIRNRGSGVMRARGPYPLGVHPTSPTPVVFPCGGRPRPRTRAESGDTEAFGVVEPGVYDADVGEHEVSDMEEGWMWMSLLTRRWRGRILLGCCRAVRGRVRGHPKSVTAIHATSKSIANSRILASLHLPLPNQA
jgi:hypothetical protein